MEPLSTRQESILNRVVDTYVQTAQPVGSRLITSLYQQIYSSSYSPATVRYEMGALEEKGYLTHPHTSAGRVPTDRGYRYYVDHSLQEESFKEDAFDQMVTGFQAESREPDFWADQTSLTLSRLADQVSLVLVSDERRRDQLFLRGSSRILENPEFQDIEKIRSLFQVFDEKTSLVEWLREVGSNQGVSVTIGEENEPKALRYCSVVSSRCQIREGRMAIIAVLGPRRMRYARMVSLINKMSQTVALMRKS